MKSAIIISALVVCLFANVFPQENYSGIQVGYQMLFTAKTSIRYKYSADYKQLNKETEKTNSIHSGLNLSYLHLFEYTDIFTFGLRGGFVLPSSVKFQRIFFGIHLRYHFTKTLFMNNDFSYSFMTWLKHGGNAGSEPYGQAWGSIGFGLNVKKNWALTLNFTIPFNTLSAHDRYGGVFLEQADFELNSFLQAGFEIYF